MICAIDFDGTVVTHEYPRIGKDIGAIPVLQRLVKNGHQLILFTMRSGDELDEALAWFHQNNIPLWGINTNPEQHEWSTSNKVYAHLYIDDAALGCPLKWDRALTRRPFADWAIIEQMLKDKGMFSNEEPIPTIEL